MTRYGDCHDWIAEHAGEPLVLTVRGRDFTFPGSGDDLSMLDALALIEFRNDVNATFEAARAGEETDFTLIGEDRQMRIIDGIIRGVQGPDGYEGMTAYLTRREYTHICSTVLNHYLWGSEIGHQTWTGELDKAGEGLGEGLTGTGSSGSNPAGKTGSTRTSTSKPRKGSARGAQSKNAGRSSKRTSTESTASTSTTSRKRKPSAGSA